MKNWLIQDAVGHTIDFLNTYLSSAKLYIYGQGMVNEDKNLYWEEDPVWNNTGDRPL